MVSRNTFLLCLFILKAFVYSNAHNNLKSTNHLTRQSISKHGRLLSNLLTSSILFPQLVNAKSADQDLSKTNNILNEKATKQFLSFKKPTLPLVDGAKVFLNGRISKFSKESIPVTSPIIDLTSGQRTIIGRMAQMTKEDSLAALTSSSQAWNQGQGKWPQMTGQERIKAIQNVIAGLKEKREEIVNVLVWEICKTTKDAEIEFDRTIEFMEATIQEYESMLKETSSVSSINGILSIVRRAAIGIMLCLGPFNYPFNETYATLIPALLMGNVAILKLPKVGGLAHILTMEVYAKYLPPGVLNFVSGSGPTTVSPMMKTGLIDILAFIGGSKAADTIIRDHPAPHRLTTYLGLEAKNVAIILPDADVDTAVRECLLGTLTYNGQRCTAIKLIMIHPKISKQFLAKFVPAVSALKIGLPWEEGVSITPLPEGTKKVEYLQGLITDAVRQGAKVLNPGGGSNTDSLMIPAVLFPVSRESKVFKEEQFGPVVPIVEFTKLSEISDYFKSTAYGQQAAVFTRDPAQAAGLVDLLSTAVGRVNINTQCGRSPDALPFSGRRSSALGTMSVSEALRAFSVPTVVAGKSSAGFNRSLLDDIQSRSRYLQPVVITATERQ